MKLHFLPLIAALSVTCGVQAQQVDSQSGATAIAQGGNVVLPAQPASTYAKVEQKGIPVASVGVAYATPPAWKCTGAGDAMGLQLEKLGLNFSRGGNDKNVCATEFRMAVVSALAEQQKTNHPAFGANLALACTDDAIADALERTVTMKCANPEGVADARKARWARERQQQRAEAILDGQPEPVAVVPRQPMPWQAGG